MRCAAFLLLALAPLIAGAAEIERIWLTHNTSLNGRGNQYPDSQSKFLAGEDSYVLLTVKRGGLMTVRIRSLDGNVLDRREFERRTE